MLRRVWPGWLVAWAATPPPGAGSASIDRSTARCLASPARAQLNGVSFGPDDVAADRVRWNRCRFDPRGVGGHYESYFLRANHPTEPLGFWIRYTIFSPRQRPEAALGELWAVWFDGARNRIHAVKNEMPMGECAFSPEALDVRIGTATLIDGHAAGDARGASELKWSLNFASTERPLLLLPSDLYDRSFPKAKAVVSAPQARFDGTFHVDGVAHAIDGWTGSQNHNWGSCHTDEYAWGQVAGFDAAPDAFLECSTASVRVGPLRTPWLTLIVLRLDGEELRLNSLWQALRARQNLRFFDWHFDSRAAGMRIHGRIHSPASSFVALPYYNPPGGTKTCLNTKLAACELTVERDGQTPRRLASRHHAAFEILTDRFDHNLPFAV